MRFLAAASIILLTTASPPAMAKDEAVVSLAKTSNWEMKYTPDSCKLITRFGSGDNSVTLFLTREQPGDAFNLELIGQPFKYGSSEKTVELTFGLDSQTIKKNGLPLTLSGPVPRPLIRLANLRFDGLDGWKHPELITLIAPEREAAITAIGVKGSDGKRYRLETGSMGPPMAAMRTCTHDLIQSWGFDPEVEAGLQRRLAPIGSFASWLSLGDYPNKALTEGHNGFVQFRLDVDAAGIPQGCRILYRTNPDEFADLTCKLLLKRARFTPALDRTGKPVKSFGISSVHWVLPDY